MKSIETPHTHSAVTAEEIATTFKLTGSSHGYDLIIPAGTRCVKLEAGGGQPKWVVDDLSFIADTKSMLYHDADHYGIPVNESSLTDIVALVKPATAVSARVQVYEFPNGFREQAQNMYGWLQHQGFTPAWSTTPPVDDKHYTGHAITIPERELSQLRLLQQNDPARWGAPPKPSDDTPSP